MMKNRLLDLYGKFKRHGDPGVEKVSRIVRRLQGHYPLPPLGISRLPISAKIGAVMIFVSLLLPALIVVITVQADSLPEKSAALVPVAEEKSKPSEVRSSTESLFLKMGATELQAKEYAPAVDFASQRTGVSQALLVALMFSESRFDEGAVSQNRYKGLMQVPYNVCPDANIIIGANILKQKLDVARGNIAMAICFYKGWQWDQERGRRQANHVVKLYRDLIAAEKSLASIQ